MSCRFGVRVSEISCRIVARSDQLLALASKHQSRDVRKQNHQERNNAQTTQYSIKSVNLAFLYLGGEYKLTSIYTIVRNVVRFCEF